MKKIFITMLCVSIFSSKNFAQTNLGTTDTEKVIADNSKVKVIEFLSSPGGNVCGKGLHSHAPHLTVILTDAEVELTTPDGKKMIRKIPAGTSFWTEGETHAIKNVGKGAVKVQLVEIKG